MVPADGVLDGENPSYSVPFHFSIVIDCAADAEVQPGMAIRASS